MASENRTDTPLFSEFPPVKRSAWEAKVRADLKGKPLESLVWRTIEGFDVAPFYTAEDLPDFDALHALPGAFPFVRGTHPDGAPAALRTDIAVADVGEANRLARRAVETGADALGFRLDVRGGRVHGVPVQSLDDFARLTDGLPLDEVPLHLMAGRASLPLLAMWLRTARARGVAPERLRGSVAHDPLGALARTGRLPLGAAFDATARALADARTHAPMLRLLACDASVFHDAGASTTQTLAFTLANASAYLAELTGRGLSVAEITGRMHFIVPVGVSYFMSIAQFRALRMLFARLVEAYAPEAKEAGRAFIHAEGSRRHLTVYDPHVNMLRNTTEAAAALIGGCDTLGLPPHDAALGRPDAFSHRMARNTGLILKHEAYLDRVVDPSAGSYYLESLTDSLARAAWELFREVEARGGMIAAMRDGFVAGRIAETRRKRDRAVAVRRQVFVGTSRYPNLDERMLDAVEATPSGAPLTEARGVRVAGASLDALMRALDAGAVLADLLAAPETEPPLTVAPLEARRGAEPFERLRLRTERFARAHGRTPSVFLLPLGDPAVRNARAAFARNFFGCAGFVVHENLGFETPEEGAEAALASGDEIVVVCAPDADYPAVVPALRRRLDAAEARPLLVVAGRPEVFTEARATGVDGFIHAGADVLDTLEAFQSRLGIRPEAEEA
ncbi:methylmalonyl-CoA mutase family protein [Rhodocaloribacter sp.]